MHILHIIHRYPPVHGGAETYLHEIGRRLAAQGHRVTVYTTDVADLEGFCRRGMRKVPSDAPSCIDGVRVKRFSTTVLPQHARVAPFLGAIPVSYLRCTFGQPLGPVLRDLVAHSRRDGPFHVVNASSYSGLMYLGAHIARRNGAALILTPHMHLGEPGNRHLARNLLASHNLRLYNSADCVLALTEIERQALVQAGVEGAKILVTRAGVTPAQVLGGQKERFRRKHGIPSSAVVVTQLSMKAYDKGVTHTVGAMEAVWQQAGTARLVLAGGSTTLFQRFYSQLSPEVKRRCLCLDDISDQEKKDLLAATDILVMPSRADSFGIAFLEAWLYGKPVIGALAGGVPEVIDEGEDGFLVPFGDKESLAQRIRLLLEQPHLAHRMGERGRQKVLGCLTWDALYSPIRDAYEALG
jgi:glycogen(starch) synthase